MDASEHTLINVLHQLSRVMKVGASLINIQMTFFSFLLLVVTALLFYDHFFSFPLRDKQRKSLKLK